MHIKYRLAELKDIDQLVKLRVKMQLEVSGLTEDRVTNEYIENVRHYFQRAMASKKYFSSIAIVDEQIIATAGVCFYEKPPSLSGGSGQVGYVANVYTEPSYREKGIGTNLVRRLNDLAKELNVDKLHLGATSEGLSIYKSVGYKEPRFVNLEIRPPFGSK